MTNICQVCKTHPAICEQIKNGKRTFKCADCRQGRRALFECAQRAVKTVKRLQRTRRAIHCT